MKEKRWKIGVQRTWQVGIFLCLWIQPAVIMAEEKELSWVSLLKYAGGIFAGAVVHEGSHALVGAVTGTSMSWEVGTYNQPVGFTEKAGSKTKGLSLYSAGFVSQAVAAEILLQWDSVDKNDAFVRGWMTWNILNPILYSLDYWVFRHSNKSNATTYQGDLEGIEHYSNERTAHLMAASFSAIALYQGYRFLKTQSWAPDWLKGESHTLHLAPTASGGFILAYSFSF